MKKLFSFIFTFAVICFTGLILYNPEICLKAAFSGLVLCGRVIIPSLYPFTFCVLFILKSGVLENFKIPKHICIFLLSLIGGYPLGAKMLNESQLSAKNASLMLNYCVNAGPAFIILSVGSGIFSSQKTGVLLFIAHILPSFLLAFLFRKKIKLTPKGESKKAINIVDNFVISATDSALALINICSFTILFSVIIGYVNTFISLRPLFFILEITNGINSTHNIYIISALLGFGGICVWCQVFALSKRIRINYLHFILCRLFHATLSAAITFILLKICNITIPTLSNGKIFVFSTFFDSGSVGISLIITGLIFIISLCSKNFAGNLLEDIV